MNTRFARRPFQENSGSCQWAGAELVTRLGRGVRVGLGLDQQGADVVGHGIGVQERGAIDVPYSARFVDEKYPQDMRHGAHVLAVRVS